MIYLIRNQLTGKLKEDILFCEKSEILEVLERNKHSIFCDDFDLVDSLIIDTSQYLTKKLLAVTNNDGTKEETIIFKISKAYIRH